MECFYLSLSPGTCLPLPDLLEKKAASCYLVPSTGSGAQLQTLQPAVALRLPAAEISPKKWQVESVWIHSHS